MVIKSPHDSWNHRSGVGRRGPGFGVICWRLDAPLSWWLIWFFAIKGVELIHLSYQTWWEEFWATDDAGISFVSNYSTTFANNLLYHAEICNNWLERWCIIVDGIWMSEMMRSITWSGQFFFISNHLWIKIYLVQPKMSHTLSFYGMYLKSFIYSRNMINSQ